MNSLSRVREQRRRSFQIKAKQSFHTLQTFRSAQNASWCYSISSVTSNKNSLWVYLSASLPKTVKTIINTSSEAGSSERTMHYCSLIGFSLFCAHVLQFVPVFLIIGRSYLSCSPAGRICWLAKFIFYSIFHLIQRFQSFARYSKRQHGLTHLY